MTRSILIKQQKIESSQKQMRTAEIPISKGKQQLQHNFPCVIVNRQLKPNVKIQKKNVGANQPANKHRIFHKKISAGGEVPNIYINVRFSAAKIVASRVDKTN